MKLSDRMVANLEGVELAMRDVYYRAAYDGIRRFELDGLDPVSALVMAMQTVCRARLGLADAYSDALLRMPARPIIMQCAHDLGGTPRAPGSARNETPSPEPR